MAWKLIPTLVEQSKNYIKWRLRCISDGTALSAVDVFSETYMPRDLKPKLQGLTYMRMKIDPSATAAPNTTINVTMSDSEGDALYTTTGNSYTAISWHDLSTDIGAYPVALAKLYLAFNDIGDANDAFDLYFICWKEPGNA